jgi:hypothetical protein
MDLLKLCAVLSLALASADGIMFYLEPNSRKCLKEEIHKQVSSIKSLFTKHK